MLVVRRRPGQSITIAGGIEIEVLQSSTGGVKLGISAPPEVTICRKEVEVTREQNRLASQAVSAQLLGNWLQSLGTAPQAPPAEATEKLSSALDRADFVSTTKYQR